MNHSFNIEVAIKLGIEKAVLIENMSFWINKNKANKQHEHDGETWTYNSTKAFSELFPYFHFKKISRLLNKLESEGYIKSGNYNKSAYDRTKWYCICNEWLEGLYLPISQKCPMENQKVSNGFPEDGNSNNTDINTYKEYSVKSKAFVGRYIKFIKTNHPTRSPNGKSVESKSLEVIDKLVRIDGFEEDYVFDCLRWAKDDEFWSTQVYSIAGLRKRSGNGLTKFQNLANARYKLLPEESKEKIPVFEVTPDV